MTKLHAKAQDALNFIVSKANASEQSPLILGNVEFWHETPSRPDGVLCYSLPVAKWDVKAVQDALNEKASLCWDELVSYLNRPMA